MSVIRHWWEGEVECDEPERGRWGGERGGDSDPGPPAAAQNLAFAPRGRVELAAMVRQDIPELAVEATVEGGPPAAESGGGCKFLSCAMVGAGRPLPALLSLLALVWLWRSRRPGGAGR